MSQTFAHETPAEQALRYWKKAGELYRQSAYADPDCCDQYVLMANAWAQMAVELEEAHEIAPLPFAHTPRLPTADSRPSPL